MAKRVDKLTFFWSFLIWSSFLFTICSVEILAQESVQSIKNFSKDDYNAAYQNWAVDVGPDGYVYTANNSGLLVYDGVNWQFFDSPEVNVLRAVKVDQTNGRIYTSGYREIGYWDWDSTGLLQYYSFKDSLQDKYGVNEEFWKILILKDQVIFQSFQALFILKDGEFDYFRPGGFLNTVSIVDDEIYVNILNQGIFKYEYGLFEELIVDDFFTQKLVRFILPWSDDSQLFGTASDGVFLLQEGVIMPFFTDHADYFKSNTINRACFIGDSVLVIGTILDGIIGLDREGKVLFNINEDVGLQNNTVLAIRNYRGGLWLALDRGLSHIQLNSDRCFTIHKTNNIGASYSAALFENYFYLGTNQGLYRKRLSESDDKFELVEGTQGQVWDCQVYDDRLFISHNSGTMVMYRGQLRRISNVGGGFSLIKNSFRINTLIQSTYNNLVIYIMKGGEWQMSHDIKGFADLIRYVELDHLNNLWAGHMRRSVYKLSLNDNQDSVRSVRYYGENSVFGKDYGNNVFKVENRIVFTTGEILYTYDDLNDSIIQYNELNSKLGKYAQSHRIVKAPDHNYWFITKDFLGLFVFEADDVTLRKEFPAGVFGNHIMEDYENVIPIDKDRAIYCLENGYAFIDLSEEIVEQKRKFNIHVTPREIITLSKSGNERRLDLSESSFIIPYWENSIRLLYACPDYQSESLKFKLLIEGLHRDWMEAENNSAFEINRLPSGEYVFTVMAENEWGLESGAHQFFLKVLPPWYRSALAWVLYVLTALIIVFWVRHVSIKRTTSRERLVQEEKEKELVRLRNQNLRADLRYKSKELANSTMSIIKKNEFLLDLKEILKEQKYQLGTRYPDKFYNHVVNKIDKNISAGDDWKIFETNVEHAHEFFLQKLIKEYPELTHSDLRLCTYLRMNLSSKEIAPLMKISVRGVENHRYRLRKKLKLGQDVNLTDFILAFEV